MERMNVVLRVLLVLLVVAGIAGIVVGALLVGADLAERDDSWHGLGIFLGTVAAGAGLLMAVPAFVALLLGRRRPRAAVTLAAVLGGVFAVGGVLLVPSGGILVGLPGMAVGAALLAASLPSLASDEAHPGRPHAGGRAGR